MEGEIEVRDGARVGVPWLGWTCGECRYCLAGRENLCDRALFTGYTLDGGYAEEVVADARYCFPLPEGPGDEELAPLLCAGLIGFRALRAAGEGECLGLFGFGAAAHIVAQVAIHEGRRVFAFTRQGDDEAPVTGSLAWRRVGGGGRRAAGGARRRDHLRARRRARPEALAAVRKGGTVVCAGIHMSSIPSFPYELLWGERVVRSVANLTRADGRELFGAVGEHPVKTVVEVFPLAEAEVALERLRAGAIRGAAVLAVAGPAT